MAGDCCAVGFRGLLLVRRPSPATPDTDDTALTAAATSSRNVPSLRDRNHPGEPPSVGSPTLTVCHSVLAAMNKCLARSNKSEVGGKATKKRTWALMRHDASGSQIDRAPSRAHVARGALRQVSRELP